MLGVYEYSLQVQVSQLVLPGQVFFDIGAHRGFFTLLASKSVGATGRVVSCEPHPESARTLRRMLAANDISNVVPLEVAVSSSAGTARLMTGDRASTEARLGADEDSEVGVEVAMVSIDLLEDRYGRPDFVKIDVEGFELQVLRGSAKLLSGPRRPVWLIETHSDDLHSKCVEILRRHGYSCETIPSPRGRARYPSHLLAFCRSPGARGGYSREAAQRRA